jgi:hypothetical protein
MASITAIESLLREKEGISKLFTKNLVIAQTFDRMGDNEFASNYFAKAYIFAQRLWAIDSQIKHRQSIKVY